ncbi:hypothetical protein IE4872_PD01628 (plasmid) [Rhizobium gallicum]|uniref:Uncharacterized protein n=1 Tax=Rhizobium gallicum TaxID=56730 RepID=A0A1L5NWB7_9HYPH|nr:hypothetical protein IE4872_PD01628 [Rhizobium gallicum]
MFYFRARDEGHYPVGICTLRNEDMKFLAGLSASSGGSAALRPVKPRTLPGEAGLDAEVRMRRPILSFLPFLPLPSRPCTDTIEHAIVALNESIGIYPWLEICTYAILMMT